MKTSQAFILSAIVMSGICIAYFSFLAIFGFPQTLLGWIIAEVIFIAILYMSYYVNDILNHVDKTKLQYPSKKIEA